MKLPAFILEELEPILKEWEQFARTILPVTQDTGTERLRDHAREMLISIAPDMGRPQSAAQRLDKSSGRESPGRDTVAETHTEHCFTSNELGIPCSTRERNPALDGQGGARRSGEPHEPTRFNPGR